MQLVHHTNLKCLPIDNGSKQTTDKKEIEGSTSPQAPEKGASNSLTKESAKHIRRLYEGSDIRVCEDCERKGDRWEMEEHNCSGR
jgi:hypothetical protein